MEFEDLKNKKILKVIYPDLEEMPDDIYANNIRVTHGSEDVVIYFGKIDPPPILKEEVEEYNKDYIKAKVVARIRLSPTIIPGFIKALENNLESFKKQGEDKNVESTM